MLGEVERHPVYGMIVMQADNLSLDAAEMLPYLLKPRTAQCPRRRRRIDAAERAGTMFMLASRPEPLIYTPGSPSCSAACSPTSWARTNLFWPHRGKSRARRRTNVRRLDESDGIARLREKPRAGATMAAPRALPLRWPRPAPSDAGIAWRRLSALRFRDLALRSRSSGNMLALVAQLRERWQAPLHRDRPAPRMPAPRWRSPWRRRPAGAQLVAHPCRGPGEPLTRTAQHEARDGRRPALPLKTPCAPCRRRATRRRRLGAAFPGQIARETAGDDRTRRRCLNRTADVDSWTRSGLPIRQADRARRRQAPG